MRDSPGTIAEVDLRDGVPADVLGEAERALGHTVQPGTVSHGNGAETAGFASDVGTWIRIQWRRCHAFSEQAWTGSEAASTLSGVMRPELLRAFRWVDAERNVVWRAEEMALVTSAVVAPRGSVSSDPRPSDEWWESLRTSLSALAEHSTSRVGMSQEHLSRRIAEIYGDAIDTTVTDWATAHADLHWGNLTAPECWILDWEDWGKAPRGLDAATLWGFSLGVPTLAARIEREFATDLAGRSGKLAQLLFCANAERAHRRTGMTMPFTDPARQAGHRLLRQLTP